MASESAAMDYHAAVDRVRSSPKRTLMVVADPSASPTHRWDGRWASWAAELSA
jgi:hypothetical protein